MKRTLAGAGAEAGFVSARTISEVVYRRIREDLLRGHFEPGRKLQSAALTALYDCGISPLREALSRLASERLVVGVGQKGFQVPDVSLTEMWDITRLRQLLEAEALRDAIASGDDKWEAQIVAAFYRLAKVQSPGSGPTATDAWERLHRDFHGALLAGCRSPWLLHLVELLYNQTERYRRLRLTRTARSKLKRNVNREHRRMMDAVLARDANRACRLLEEHLERTALFITSCFQEEDKAGAAAEARPGRRPGSVRAAIRGEGQRDGAY